MCFCDVEGDNDDDDYDYIDYDDDFFPMPMPMPMLRRRDRRSIVYPGHATSNFVDSNEAFLVSTVTYMYNFIHHYF